MSGSMRAVYIEGHEGLASVTVGRRPKPAPGPGEVLIRIAASALNRVDLYMCQDGSGFRHGLPLILGVDGAGVIEAVGANVTVRKPGERVVIYPARFGLDEFSRRGDQMLSFARAVPGENIDGCYADYIVMPEECAFPIADSLSFREAAVLPTAYLTAWRMVVTAGAITQEDWVLIHGIGGGASLAALQFCAMRRARVIVTSSSDEKLAVAKSYGAEVLVNYRRQNVLDEVRRATNRRGVDVVLENVGEATWDISLKAVVGGGRIVVCGATTGPNPKADLQRVFIRQLHIVGVTIGNFEEFRTLIDAAERKLFVPHIDRVFPLEQVPEGLALLDKGGQTGKIGVVVDPDLGA
ncbi:MAG: zinc-binding dehydrogenase [Rhodospirillaceae bacterium]|nr:zinc-binding dehydrogenase [Rhodospirillaceae bacterium]